MKIAIVDDSKSERSTLRRLILEYFNTSEVLYGITPTFTEYENGETFLLSYSQGKYQIIVLDIYMNELTGIEVAKKIVSLEKNCNIIFFTISEDHMLDGYDCRALGYVLKPITEHRQALYNALSHAMDRLCVDNSSLEVLTPFGKQSVFYRDIVYLEVSMRNLYIHFRANSLQIQGKYSDYSLTLLEDRRFLECYRNIIVNMDYINTPLEYDFLLKNNEKLPISRRKKTEVMETYMQYFINNRYN